MKKFTAILALGLAATLSVGSFVGYAYASENATPLNTVVTVSAGEETREADLKAKAVQAFSGYFGVDVTASLKEKNSSFFDASGKEMYLAQWSDSNSEYTNEYNVYCTALLEAKSGRVINLNYHPGEPKNADYSKYTLEEAQALADAFIEKSGILSDDYTVDIERNAAMNDTAVGYDYYFSYIYDNDKECIVTVNKDTQAVNSFNLVDEVPSLG